jgi:hypothetical protein
VRGPRTLIWLTIFESLTAGWCAAVSCNSHGWMSWLQLGLGLVNGTFAGFNASAICAKWRGRDEIVPVPDQLKTVPGTVPSARH